MNYPLPTMKQEEWADQELGVIIHYTMETYKPELKMEEFKCSRDKLPPEIFAPTHVDTDQWLRTAKSMGAQYAVFVANHVTGFSLWPTKLNDYSIASSPYMNGEADIIADFVASCKKYDIKPGLYYSTGCNGHYGINDDFTEDYTSERYQQYVKIVEAQIKEVWSQYGEFFEIWFDGGIIPYDKGGPNIMPLLNKYQPQAICFQGPAQHRTNVRWVGNENGLAPMDCWSTNEINTCAFGGDIENHLIGLGDPDGAYWMPAESDMGNRHPEAFGGGWGYREGEDHLVLSPEHLLNCYYNSVGRNSNLLMGMAITQEGYFPDEEQFEAFGKLVKDIYQSPLQSTRGVGREFELIFPEPTDVTHLILMEDIHYGERIRDYSVEITTTSGTKEIFHAGCIGHKRIIKLDEPILGAKLMIHKAVDEPIIKSFTAYK